MITAAAAVMVAVFGAFAISGDRVLAMFGVALASPVFLDAVVVRLLLLPAVLSSSAARPGRCRGGLTGGSPQSPSTPSRVRHRTRRSSPCSRPPRERRADTRPADRPICAAEADDSGGWRRQAQTPPSISEFVFTDPDTIRKVIHTFNRDGVDAPYPRYKGGQPQTFTLPTRQEIRRIALSDPDDLGQSSSTWSLSKLTDYLVAEGWSRTSLTRAFGSCSSRRTSAFNR